MSDTPRTDAKSFGSQVMAHEMVHADFARELERELQKDKERLDWILKNHMVKGEWETSEDDDRIEYIYPDREAIDEAISPGDC
jgi:predicted secreted Zn-dependent protease